MSDELKTYIEPEMEARLVALVLGEASAFEAEELERLIAERVELQACKERLEQIHGVLVAAHDRKDDEKWKLAEERRGKIFERVEETRREKSRREKQERARKRAEKQGRRKLVMLCAACLVAGMIVIVFQSTFDSIKVSDGEDLMATAKSEGEMEFAEQALLERPVSRLRGKPAKGLKVTRGGEAAGGRLKSNFDIADLPKLKESGSNSFEDRDEERKTRLSRALAQLGDSVVAELESELPPADQSVRGNYFRYADQNGAEKRWKRRDKKPSPPALGVETPEPSSVTAATRRPQGSTAPGNRPSVAPGFPVTPAEADPTAPELPDAVSSAPATSRPVAANGTVPVMPKEESAGEVMDQRRAGRESTREEHSEMLRKVVEKEAKKKAVPAPAGAPMPARPGQTRAGVIAANSAKPAAPSVPRTPVPDPSADFGDGNGFGDGWKDRADKSKESLAKLEEKQEALERVPNLGDLPKIGALFEGEEETTENFTRNKKGQSGGDAGGLLPGADAAPAPATKPAPPAGGSGGRAVAGRSIDAKAKVSERDLNWHARVQDEFAEAEVEELEEMVDELKSENEALGLERQSDSDRLAEGGEDPFGVNDEEADFGRGREGQGKSRKGFVNGGLGGGGGLANRDKNNLDFIPPVKQAEIPGVPASSESVADGVVTGGLPTGKAGSDPVSESGNNSLSIRGDLEEREVARRQAQTTTADGVGNEGKDAFAKGDFETATRKYREALSTLPPGTATEQRRKDLEKALEDSSLALTREYRQTGRYEEARKLLEEVERNDPGNPALAKNLDYLDDPIRSNPSLTYEHSKKVDQVRRGLYTGEGYYDLGLYDKADEEFKKVLRNDPYNKAARQWMERTSAIKNSYYRAAYDQTRAEMLMEVDRAWELGVPPDSNEILDGGGVSVDVVDDGASTEFLFGMEEDEAIPMDASAGALSIVSKLDRIVLPDLNLQNATVGEALELLRERSVELDDTTLDETKKGVNLVGEDAEVLDAKLPPLNLDNVSLSDALKTIGDASGNFVHVDDYAVRLGDNDNSDPFVASPNLKVIPDVGQTSVVLKLKQIILPEIDLESSTVGEALDFIRLRAAELDNTTLDDGKKGFGVEVGELVDSNATIGELKLRQVPLEVAVREIARQAGLKVRIDEKGILVSGDPKARKPKIKSGFETLASEKSDSTFSLNVSDVSFKLTKAALAEGKRPQADKIRPEEFVNAMNYDDVRPTQAEKICCEFEQGVHPFLSQRNLMRISMSTASLGRNAGTPLRLTLLLDQSGSMERSDRVESLKRAFALLASQLTPNDEVTLIGFARSPRLLAERVKGNEVSKLAAIIANPLSEGGTNLEEALAIGIQLAKQQFVQGAQNRIILLTDGAANLGDAKPETLAMQVESMRKAGISFDACGVGAEGLNDDILSSLAKKGDGRYYFLNRPEDADQGFARQIAGSLRPAAKNVKVQVLFNPDRVTSFKLYGFEKHKLKKEDFRNDKVDAAEMAAEESGVALYHFEANPEGRGDVGTVSVRFLDTSSNQMVERTWVIPYEEQAPFFNEADPKLRLAGVAGLFAERLKGSPVGERVELKRLRQVMPPLKAYFGNQSRFGELETMLRQAGE